MQVEGGSQPSARSLTKKNAARFLTSRRETSDSAVSLVSELRPTKVSTKSKPRDPLLKDATSCRECP